jgi:hypothetical protein
MSTDEAGTAPKSSWKRESLPPGSTARTAAGATTRTPAGGAALPSRRRAPAAAARSHSRRGTTQVAADNPTFG